jgi:hypothetical protein
MQKDLAVIVFSRDIDKGLECAVKNCAKCTPYGKCLECMPKTALGTDECICSGSFKKSDKDDSCVCKEGLYPNEEDPNSCKSK